MSQVKRGDFSCAISSGEMDAVGLSMADLSADMELISHIQLGNTSYSADGAKISASDIRKDYGPFLCTLRDAGYSQTIGLPVDAGASVLKDCRDVWREKS